MHPMTLEGEALLKEELQRLKFEEPGNYSILIEIDDQVVLASTFPITLHSQ